MSEEYHQTWLTSKIRVAISLCKLHEEATVNTSRTTSVLAPFAAVVLAMLPGVLDQTMLATGLPVIAGELGRISDVSWVVTAYVVAAAAATPLWGKLGDRLGRKRMLELALAGFVGASALCGAAQDMTQLIVLRLVQGTTAGGLMALAMAAVGDLVSPRERGRYQGYIAATFAVATIVGPLLGGALVEGPGWRWVFLVNLPVGLVALAGLRLRLPAAPVERPEHRLDGLGAGLLAAATSTLMLACIQSEGRVALIAATVVLSGALVVQERRAADPIVPLGLLRTPTVALVSAALFLAIAALFAITVFVPLFLQTTTGATPTEAGLLLVPAMLGITVSTTLSGRSIARTGRYKRFPVAGLALMTAALAALALVAADPSRVATAIALTAFGLGFGMVTQVLVTAVQNAVDRRELGIATATTGFFRALGGAVGAAVLGAVFAAQAGASATEGDGGGMAGVVRADVIDGVQAVFAVAAPLAALALLAVLAIREVPLKTAPARDGRGTGPMPAAASEAS
jgi:EmrB/QacA subfamily drug resistance transporter